MAICKSSSYFSVRLVSPSPCRLRLAVFHSADSSVPLTSQPCVFVPTLQLSASFARQSCHSVNLTASVSRHPYCATESPAPVCVVPITSQPVLVTDRYVFAPFLSQMSPSLLRLTKREENKKKTGISTEFHTTLSNPKLITLGMMNSAHPTRLNRCCGKPSEDKQGHEKWPLVEGNGWGIRNTVRKVRV